jgi:hypothetical protein
LGVPERQRGSGAATPDGVGSAVVGDAVVGVAVVGAAVVGAADVGAAVVGAADVGAAVVGAADVGAAVVGAAVGLAVVVGAAVVGFAVVGAAVVGLSVTGAMVGLGVGGMRHGAPCTAHDTLLSAMTPFRQHLLQPPGKRAQPSPAHLPLHSSRGQHACRDCGGARGACTLYHRQTHNPQ